jgi:hypothetical protein
MAQILLFFKSIGQLALLLGKVIDLFVEKDKKKAEAKKESLDKLTNAAKETDKKKRASKLNRVIDDVNRL